MCGGDLLTSPCRQRLVHQSFHCLVLVCSRSLLCALSLGFGKAYAVAPVVWDSEKASILRQSSFVLPRSATSHVSLPSRRPGGAPPSEALPRVAFQLHDAGPSHG